MGGDPVVRQGFSDSERVLPLLNESFNNWGDESLYRWKYDEFPSFSEDDVFYVTVDDDLVAFRRVFDKQIIANGNELDICVFGDTCVTETWRSEGLYTLLLEETDGIYRASQNYLGCTFNRKGSITFEKKLSTGWQYRRLPVFIHVRSPVPVVRKYAQTTLDRQGPIASFIRRYGHRLGFSVGGHRLRADELVRNRSSTIPPTVTVPIPRDLVELLVEIASRDSTPATFRRRIALRLHDNRSTSIGTDTLDPSEAVDNLDSIETLYDSIAKEYDLQFRRDQVDLNHMFAHPYLDKVVVARRKGDLVGVATMAIRTDSVAREARVLDFVAVNEEAFRGLEHRIRREAAKQDVDLIVMLADTEPGPAWIQVDKQVIMWERYRDDAPSLDEGSLMIGLYDVV